MMHVQDGEPFASGMAATGFWLENTLCRVILEFVTPWVGEKLAIIVRSLGSILMLFRIQLLFMAPI